MLEIVDPEDDESVLSEPLWLCCSVRERERGEEELRSPAARRRSLVRAEAYFWKRAP